MSVLKDILIICVPVFVALIGIIPTIISNRKKTQESIEKSNEAIRSDVASTKRDIDSTRAVLVDHISEADDEKARNQRYRILRFYDEMCEHRKHSESHFEDILDDIDAYEKYCESHPDFKNNRGHVAMQHIKEKYGHVKQTGGFLTYGQAIQNLKKEDKQNAE